MEPYTTEGVARREYNNSNPQAADTDSESGSVTDLHMSASNSSLQSNVSNVSISTPEIQYELVGVIVHSGQANAGHYYSFIKDRCAQIRITRTQFFGGEFSNILLFPRTFLKNSLFFLAWLEEGNREC